MLAIKWNSTERPLFNHDLRMYPSAMTLDGLFCGNTGNKQHCWFCWFCWNELMEQLSVLLRLSVLINEEANPLTRMKLKLLSAAVRRCHQETRWNSSSVCHGGHHLNVSVCLWAGGCCHGVDLHVLHIDGIKGLISMYHRTKHHRLQQNKRTVQYF